jgi:hypothetical protein
MPFESLILSQRRASFFGIFQKMHCTAGALKFNLIPDLIYKLLEFVDRSRCRKRKDAAADFEEMEQETRQRGNCSAAAAAVRENKYIEAEEEEEEGISRDLIHFQLLLPTDRRSN